MDKTNTDIEREPIIEMFEDATGKKGIIIAKGQYGNRAVEAYRRDQGEREDAFMAIPVAQRGGIDKNQVDRASREAIDPRENSQTELEEKLETFCKLYSARENLELPKYLHDILDKIDAGELDMKTIKGKMIDAIVVNNDRKIGPGEAAGIVNKIIEDGKDFDEAVVEEQERPNDDGARDTDDRVPWPTN